MIKDHHQITSQPTDRSNPPSLALRLVPPRWSWRVATGIALLATFGMVVAFGPGRSSANSSKRSLTSSTKAPLVVYAAIGFDSQMGAAFQKATGIPTEVVEIRTGELLARVEAEKHNAQWDLLWFDGAFPMWQLARQGLLVGYRPKANWTHFGALMQPGNGQYVTVGATFADVITVNTKTLPRNQWPTSWSDLQEPRYKVGMDNPSISGETSSFVLGRIDTLGQVGAFNYFRKLKRSGLKIYNVNPITDQALQYGEINVGLVQSSSALGHAASGLPFHVIYADPETLVPRVMGISAMASPGLRHEAGEFIRFELSSKGQTIARDAAPTGDSNEFTVLKRDPARKGIPSLAQLQSEGVKIQYLPPHRWATRNAAANSWFATHIVQD